MSEAGGGGPIIEAVDVVKTYDRRRVRALDGLSLSVAEGEFVAVTGPSGCGKSTLLHLLAALDRPDSGRLVVDGADLSRLRDPDRFRRSQVGLVFQLHNLLPHLSALANVQIAMLGASHGRRRQRDRAMELLGAVGLGDLARRRPPELSGGERQRVALARALANDPRIVLADEPTGSLDREARAQVLDVLAGLRATSGTTLVVVTHDDVVAEAADRVVHLERGKVAGARAATLPV